MRGARFLLAVCAALALAGCVHEQYAQQPGPRAAAPAPSARHLYSTSPAYAQQAYEQPFHQMDEAQPASADDRGLFNVRTDAPVYAAPPPPPPRPSPAVGGPYVAEPYGYAAAPAAVVTAAVSERPYTLDTGDRLRVVVFGQDGITNSYTVDAGGKVNLPLIGAVTARGLTNQQLAAAITARLKQGYVREPHVSVEVETYRPFFILGEVTTPGQYPYVVNMTAETAIAIAGGFAPRAFKTTVEVTRKAGGQQVRMQVPLDYPVRPGDTILVKERWF
jgi:polysaccharide export outer membrane protein